MREKLVFSKMQSNYFFCWKIIQCKLAQLDHSFTMKKMSWKVLSWHIKMYSYTARMTDFVKVMLFSGGQISVYASYNP